MSEATGDRTPTPGDQVMVVGPDGQPVGTVRVPNGDDGAADDPAGDGTGDAPAERENLSGAVEEPAKVMRIGMMIKQLLEEVRAHRLDDASRGRLSEIHASSLRELETACRPTCARSSSGSSSRSATTAPVGARAARRAGPARRLARGAVPRHPDRAGGPADGRPGAARADAPGPARRRVGRRRAAARPGQYL